MKIRLILFEGEKFMFFFRWRCDASTESSNSNEVEERKKKMKKNYSRNEKILRKTNIIESTDSRLRFFFDTHRVEKPLPAVYKGWGNRLSLVQGGNASREM